MVYCFRPGRTRQHARAPAAVLGAVLLAVLVLLPTASTAGAAVSSRPRGAGSGLPTVGDNASVSFSFNGTTITVRDGVTDQAPTPTVRSYTIRVAANPAAPAARLNLVTDPWAQWAVASQLGGPDGLAPTSAWSWAVWTNGSDDSANWTVDGSGNLTRAISASAATFTVVGAVNYSVSVAVNASRPDGSRAAGLGLVLNDPEFATNIPTNDPDYAGLLRPISPGLLRVTLGGSTVTWVNSTGQATFVMPSVGLAWNLSQQLGSPLLLSLPAGSWGDGNFLPAGMPVNQSLPVPATNGSYGYFPADAAFVAYVSDLVNATLAAGWHIRYFNIGNEVPVAGNGSYAAEFAELFSRAAGAIHRLDPSALVGTDVMLFPTELSYFATHAGGVDYLGFHFYPAQGDCGASFCPPNGANGYLTNDGLFGRSANFSGATIFVAPKLAQLEWYNASGRWLPIFDLESNVNSEHTNGTDPRQQSVVGAAWTASSLIDGSRQNLSAFTYFTWEGVGTSPSLSTYPDGGWGYGMANEGGANDSDLRYAPYWAAELWHRFIPAGAPGLWSTVSDQNAVRAYSASNSTGVGVYLANRLGTATTVHLSVSGAEVRSSALAGVDERSYSTGWGAGGNLQLLQSGEWASNLSGGAQLSVTIDGYGVAAAWFDWATAGGSNQSGGNSTGNSTTGSGGTNQTQGTGGSGNQSGGTNSTGPTPNATAGTTPPGGGGHGAGRGPGGPVAQVTSALAGQPSAWLAGAGLASVGVVALVAALGHRAPTPTRRPEGVRRHAPAPRPSHGPRQAFRRPG